MEIGVRSFGRGIFHKEPIDGTALGNKRVFRIEPGDLVLSNVFAWEGAVARRDRRRVGNDRIAPVHDLCSRRRPDRSPLGVVVLSQRVRACADPHRHRPDRQVVTERLRSTASRRWKFPFHPSTSSGGLPTGSTIFSPSFPACERRPSVPSSWQAPCLYRSPCALISMRVLSGVRVGTWSHSETSCAPRRRRYQ